MPTAPEPPRAGELALLAGLLIYASAFLAIKGPVLAALLPANPDPRLHDTVNALLKLTAFTAVPLLVYLARYRSLPAAGKPVLSRRRLLLSFAVLASALVAVSFVVSQGAKNLLEGSFTPMQMTAGVVLCSAWMAIEAGVVEEVFFRWLLQSRVAALTGSSFSAVFLGALLFGLAHAPGMWLRGAGASEGLGGSPDLVHVLAYCITVQGVAGLLFGVLWARTRSLAMLIGLHAVVDGLSNATDFIATWHL